MQLIKATRYTDTVAETIFNNLEKDLVLFAQVQGETNGKQNRPVTEGEFRALFLNKVESKIQPVMDENQKLHLPVSGVVVSQKGEADATETIKPLAATLNDKELEFRKLQQQKKEFTPNTQIRNIRRAVYTGAAVIAFTEGVLAIPGIRRIPLSWIPTLITAAAIAIAVGFGTHILAGYIKRAKTKAEYTLRFCISVIPVFFGFYILGHLRTRGYAAVAQANLDVHQNVANNPSVSPMGITILSFLLFLAALIFSIKYYKTEQEAKEDAVYDKVCKELKECDKKMQEIRSTIEKTKNSANTQSSEALFRYEYALTIENRLKALATQVTQEYILKNLNYRTDGQTPVFFSEPPAFRFRLFFDNVKKNKS